MKNRLSTIVLIVYSIILFIFSCSTNFVDVVNIAISNSFNNSTVIYNVLTYLEVFILFLGFGICMTIFCIDNFKQFKYIITYSFILSILAVIVDMVIKSFTYIDFYRMIIALIAAIVGVIVEILLKIKQVRGDKDEE